MFLLEGLRDEVAEPKVGQVGEEVGLFVYPTPEEAIYLFTHHSAGWYLSHGAQVSFRFLSTTVPDDLGRFSFTGILGRYRPQKPQGSQQLESGTLTRSNGSVLWRLKI